MIALAIFITVLNLLFMFGYHFPPARREDVMFNGSLYVWGWRLMILAWLSPTFVTWAYVLGGSGALWTLSLLALATITGAISLLYIVGWIVTGWKLGWRLFIDDVTDPIQLTITLICGAISVWAVFALVMT